ncbi:MAG: hypothetical protein FWD06_03410 [Oscillospiraceae bacterium]|nr:hypothetical protein [Oscillospiraceae bacterium]
MKKLLAFVLALILLLGVGSSALAWDDDGYIPDHVYTVDNRPDWWRDFFATAIPRVQRANTNAALLRIFAFTPVATQLVGREAAYDLLQGEGAFSELRTQSWIIAISLVSVFLVMVLVGLYFYIRYGR